MYLDLQSIFFSKGKKRSLLYFRTRKAPNSVPRTHRSEHRSLRSKAEGQEVDRAKWKHEKRASLAFTCHSEAFSVKNLKNPALILKLGMPNLSHKTCFIEV